MTLIIPKAYVLDIRKEGARIVILKDGQAVLDLPWQGARQLARAIARQAAKCEEEAAAEQIALDQAILLRAGAPIGLTNHPEILKEAAKEAAWNSHLRRAMPGGIKSAERVGKPALLQHPPRKKP